MGERNERTALITGASSGLGLEFAKLFADSGYRVVLVARRKAKLDELARKLERKHRVETVVMARDLAAGDAPETIGRELGNTGVPVDVLVNNAGFGTYGEFAKTDRQEQLDMIQVNITALAHLTHRLLPGMIERGHGRILNVASTAAFQPGPLMAVYYASKAFVLSFSEALANELKGTGVTVTVCCPGPTTTDFHSSADMDISRAHRFGLMMDASKVARVGYEAMKKGKPLVIPGMGNWMLAQSVRLTPRRLVPVIVKELQQRVIG